MATRDKHRERSKRSYAQKQNDREIGFIYISSHNNKAPQPGKPGRN